MEAALQKWTLCYRKRGGLLVRLGFLDGDIEFLSLRPGDMCGQPREPYFQRNYGSRQMRELETPIPAAVQRVLKQSEEKELYLHGCFVTYTLLPPPKLYGDGLYECHFVLLKTAENI